jgi:hypothetical protein
MKTRVFGLALFSAVALAASAPAEAQNGTLTRSFVSSAGVDTNPCTITQPCATFAHAYTAVGANGIVAALDPGKYGPLTISGPVTINGNGWAAITGPSGGDAIEIGAVSGNVTLTGLELDGAGTSNYGIHFAATTSETLRLTIRDCVISNFANSGIAFQPSASSNVFEYLLITNTISSNNQNGIKVAPGGSALALGSITGTTVANNTNNGFDFEGASLFTVVASFSNLNSANGIYENFTQGGLTLRDTISSLNSTDFDAASGAGVIYLYHNTFGSFMGNGGIYSDGTNQFTGLVTGDTPTKQSTY